MLGLTMKDSRTTHTCLLLGVVLSVTWTTVNAAILSATNAANTQRTLSPRQRLQGAIDVSRDLAAKGQGVNDDSLKSLGLEPCEPMDRDKPLLFPRIEDVETYMRARPWALNHASWPTQTDGPKLRKLLEDKDPAMRCAAIEALATLHQPEDVERIGRLLTDDADGLPALGLNRLLTATFIQEEKIVAGGLQRMRSWHNRTVAATARLALKLMTGTDLTANDFEKWWQRNNEGRNCVWYWQQRLTRELTAHPEGIEAVRQTVATEFAQLPAEIEARIRLGAIN